jgi:hypothetical protein
VPTDVGAAIAGAGVQTGVVTGRAARRRRSNHTQAPAVIVAMTSAAAQIDSGENGMGAMGLPLLRRLD